MRRPFFYALSSRYRYHAPATFVFIFLFAVFTILTTNFPLFIMLLSSPVHFKMSRKALIGKDEVGGSNPPISSTEIRPLWAIFL